MRTLGMIALVALVALVAVNVEPALGQIPKQLSYQGVLTDTLGNPMPDNTYVMVFRLYSVSAAGTAFWTEVKNVPVKDGIFSTYLGDTTPFSDTVTWAARTGSASRWVATPSSRRASSWRRARTASTPGAVIPTG